MTKTKYFWAKTTGEGNPGISVFGHMMNVGCVAQCISEHSPELLNRFQLQPFVIGALAALHDLGKISPGFQRKCEKWLEENDLITVARNGCWDTAMESSHGKVSHAAIQAFLSGEGLDRKTAKYLSTVLGAHHGRLSPPNDRGYRPSKAISESNSRIDWDAERMANARMIWDRFLEGAFKFALSDESPSLWWIAGLTTVADWIGSNEQFFPSDRNADVENSLALAWHAINALGFKQIKVKSDLSFHDLFHDSENPKNIWAPNEMQEKTLATVTGPGVYVIEAPMGMGKTEAALWAAYHLLTSRKASGIYFALPTQATSNRIHLRLNEFLRRISPKNTSRLIHGNSWLMESSNGYHPAVTCKKENATGDARAGRDWFASTKRALLAPFGVGTVDQALLGVVAAKHFFVRHFALAGKVVILDEVHSYDLYTGTLIDKLISTLEDLGCTVIVLSATLSENRLERIITFPDNASNNSPLPYPLITGRKDGKPMEPTPATPPEPKSITVDFVAADDATSEAVHLARNGGSVLWICNTVDAAQKQYLRFMELAKNQLPMGLLHSRFPFRKRETIETEWMERFGKNGKTRCGSILVATQVVEQSADLDADLLITELAPTDMLLQRLGRLWRHKRGERKVEIARVCIIEEANSLEEFRAMEPEPIEKALGSKAHVYAPYILLRSLEVWKSTSQVSIPTEIRHLIESTYMDREEEPDSWVQLFCKWFGTDSAKKMNAMRNCNLWQVALEDEEGVQTRLNDLPTMVMVLCRSITDQEALFIDGSRGSLGNDQYCFTTAQSINKNLVKVPEYCFDSIEPCLAFTDYLKGKQSVGIISESGEVEVHGLKSGIQLRYTDELGLVIEKSS